MGLKACRADFNADAATRPAGERRRPSARPTRGATTTGAARRPAGKAAPEPRPLAIPGYDTLSASQVIPRLDALRPDELEAVRHHEAGHRARRTILSRIAQLQG